MTSVLGFPLADAVELLKRTGYAVTAVEVRCKKGVLKRVNGKNGPFWTCSRYPDCRTTYADRDGNPVMPVTAASVEKKVST